MSPQAESPNVHHALFFGSDAELIDLAVPFLRAGLAEGDALVLVCEEPKQSLLVDALGDDDRITSLERSTIYQQTVVAVESYRRVIERLLRDGAGRVRLVGEVDFGETAATWTEWSRFEAVVNVALAPYPYWNVCAYDTRTLSGPILAAGLATHPNLLTQGGRTGNARYEQPSALLRRWADHDPDPIEACDPALVFTLTDATELSALRDEVEFALALAGVPGPSRSDLVIAVSEVAANGLVHGRPPVLVRVWGEPERLVVTLTDQGAGIDDPLAG